MLSLWSISAVKLSNEAGSLRLKHWDKDSFNSLLKRLLLTVMEPL
ncbi:hypothetical protein [Pseudomonas phage IR-QUMS-PaBa1-GHS-2021]|nr:hypothetical protein [Pseudomonas phage IR-QUMS-PaBa1-GHS-2021]